ncbi:hypothetical protein N7486_006653 [Penicillium sp. IBT 16267x]|nr:hypothetical protein N7486_006653 [Penicillium sp. IBT 16267x]
MTQDPVQSANTLINHLTTKHDATPEFAERIASLWHLGRGVDFRGTVIQTYRFSNIFGETVGPAVQRSVQEECWNQWRASQLGTLSLCGLMFCVVLAGRLDRRFWYVGFWSLGTPLGILFFVFFWVLMRLLVG